jgi:hypothetical protein
MKRPAQLISSAFSQQFVHTSLASVEVTLKQRTSCRRGYDTLHRGAIVANALSALATTNLGGMQF